MCKIAIEKVSKIVPQAPTMENVAKTSNARNIPEEVKPDTENGKAEISQESKEKEADWPPKAQTVDRFGP